MKDLQWLDIVHFQELSAAEQRQLLITRRHQLLKQQERLELQQRELATQQARLD